MEKRERQREWEREKDRHDAILIRESLLPAIFYASDRHTQTHTHTYTHSQTHTQTQTQTQTQI